MRFKITAIGSVVLLLVLYTVTAGAFRKWGGVSGLLDNLLLLIQLVAPVIIIFLVKRRENRNTSIWLMLYLFYLFVCAINPMQLTWYHAFFGLIIHLGFFTLMFTYLLSAEKISDRYWNVTFLIVGFIEIIVASFQYVSAPDAWINRFAVANDAEAINTAFVGDAVRATGTFSYIAGYTSFLIFFLFFLLYRLRVYKGNPWNLPLLIFGLYGSLLSGSRSMLVTYVSTLLLFSITELKIGNGKQIFRAISAVFLIFIVNTLLGDPVGLSEKFERSWDNFSDRWASNSGEGQQRLFQEFDFILSNDFKYDLTGVGLGATYQGATSKWGTSPYVGGTFFEGELFRLVIEGGYLLLIFHIALIGFILFKLNFSLIFKLYLFVVIGIYSTLAFNIYNTVFIACGLIVLDTAYRREKEHEDHRIPIR